MAKVKVELLGASVNGKPVGSQIEIEQADAKYLESIGYVRIIEEKKASPKKQAPKKPEAKGG